jgi:hypothetical protein
MYLAIFSGTYTDQNPSSKKRNATPAVIHEYRKMITDAKLSLHNHLERLEDSLRARNVHEEPASATDIVSQDKLKEEKGSIEQCIEICSRAHTYIDGIESRHQQSTFTENIDGHGLRPTVVSDAVQLETLVGRNRWSSAIPESQVRSKLYDLETQINSLIEQKKHVSDEDKEQLEKMKEERDMLAQCLNVCSQAESALANDTLKDIVSESGSQHLIVTTTLGDLISARRISSRSSASRLLGGQISDETPQRLSRDLEINTRSNVEFQD